LNPYKYKTGYKALFDIVYELFNFYLLTGERQRERERTRCGKINWRNV